MQHFRRSLCGEAIPRRLTRRGAIVILVVVCLPVVLAFAVFALNIAWMQLTRTELRTATDAAAKAGSRILSREHDAKKAKEAVHEAAGRNSVGGEALLLAAEDVQFGFSTSDVNGFWTMVPRNEDDDDLNAVRVTGRRTADSPGGPVPLLFTGLFDRSTFEPIKAATATHIDRDIVLVLDRSGSMATVTPTGTRWTDLQQAVYAFLNALQQTPQIELVGLVTYSTTATADLSLRSEYQSIADAVADLGPDGSTAIGDGIDNGRTLVKDPSLSRPYARKTIVVMTDGIHNTGQLPEPVAAAAAQNDFITVHTITFSDGADQVEMENVAIAGGGKHWHADDQASLIDVFEEVANNLPTLLIE